MKRIFVLFLVVVILVSSLALSSCEDIMNIFSSNTDEGSNGLVYRLNPDGETCTLVGTQNCMDTNIVIPSYFNGKKVTAIDEFAFSEYGQCKIENITIPKTVDLIHKHAFYRFSEADNRYISLHIDTITFKMPYPNPTPNGKYWNLLDFRNSLRETIFEFEDRTEYYEDGKGWITKEK